MKRKILLFSRDPGGANTVMPLVKPLKANGYDVLLYGKDTALERYELSGFTEASDLMSEIQTLSESEVKDFLNRIKPDFIITGTSINDMSDRYIWLAAKQLNIKTFAVLDQWINYGVRFSRHCINEINQFDKSTDVNILPDKILVMDETAKSEAVNDGVPSDRIIITGQPHFENILKIRDSLGSQGLNDWLCPDCNSDYVILFVSEPIKKAYSGRENPCGYDEQTIFSSIYTVLNDISLKYNRNITVIAKLHPTKNDAESFSQYLNITDNTNVKVILDESSSQYDLLALSDLVIGMSSMLLLEAVIFEKPVISVQIGLKAKNPFILDRIGALESVTDEITLKNNIMDLIVNNITTKPNFFFIKNPVENIINSMEKNL